MSSQDLEFDDVSYAAPELTVPDPTAALSMTLPEKFTLVATIAVGVLASVLAATLIAPFL